MYLSYLVIFKSKTVLPNKAITICLLGASCLTVRQSAIRSTALVVKLKALCKMQFMQVPVKPHPIQNKVFLAKLTALRIRENMFPCYYA